ncbi:hypothetical protein HXX76_015040 [Chlamydomonas incerta]|uniref:BTB domain-containing protein n=1 Tax=Chlamydomonas incerta TaxID=51695 RepID=A0A835VSE3_CHLIN|nr:hypothetical protein HXX76_015040 [Chlamydomonas incerta]|eukprot:KAG2423764.1 hypothetical protein HXX76_015040 [Chlamydomonas incerta]
MAQSPSPSPEPEQPSCCPGSSLVTLTFSVQGAPEHLVVDRALLWFASPVLQGLIEATCGADASGAALATPAPELPLLSDSAADWKVALALLQHRASPLAAINWSNVAGLCRLADKYDMPAVRNYCAWFLTANVTAMSLAAPLTSPQNLLHAASLAERYFAAAAATEAGGRGAAQNASGGAGATGAGAGVGAGAGLAGPATARVASGGGSCQASCLPQHVAPIGAALKAALQPLVGLSLVPPAGQPQPQPQPLDLLGALQQPPAFTWQQHPLPAARTIFGAGAAAGPAAAGGCMGAQGLSLFGAAASAAGGNPFGGSRSGSSAGASGRGSGGGACSSCGGGAASGAPGSGPIRSLASAQKLLLNLRALTGHAAYADVVAPGVQAQVVWALMAGLDQALEAASQAGRSCGADPLSGGRV